MAITSTNIGIVVVGKHTTLKTGKKSRGETIDRIEKFILNVKSID